MMNTAPKIEFLVDCFSLESLNTDCILLPVGPGQTLSSTGLALDVLCNKRLSTVLSSGDLPKILGATLLIHTDGPIKRVLLVSFDMESSDDVAKNAKNLEYPAKDILKEQDFILSLSGLWNVIKFLDLHDTVSYLHEISVDGRDIDWAIKTQIIVFMALSYRCDFLKKKPDLLVKGPKYFIFPTSQTNLERVKLQVRQACCIGEGIQYARQLGDLPPNYCTPAYLADTASSIGAQMGFPVEVLDKSQIEALGMGAFLAVSQGSVHSPKLIVMKYLKSESSKEKTLQSNRFSAFLKAPIVIVGKGITFDSGGISLKPGQDMDEMKYDMSGASAVLGVILAVARMQLPIDVIGIIPTAENMPSGNAVKPGDIVTSLSGKTIEILNTDAEGRLILCDALTYAERFNPAAVIDIATLTGACVIALGHHHSGLFSTDELLAQALEESGKDSNDTCWRMPLDNAYQEQLKSRFADVANIGGRPAGSVTAACFLSRFSRQYPWAHLDVAGTAWKSGKSDKGATGRPVHLLVNFLCRLLAS